jgi:hypothetical protein
VILDIEGANASWADNKLHVAFDVVPEERSHLDFEIGVVQHHGLNLRPDMTIKPFGQRICTHWRVLLAVDDANLPDAAQKGSPSKVHCADMQWSAEVHVRPEIFRQPLWVSLKVGMVDAGDRQYLDGELSTLTPAIVEAAL